MPTASVVSATDSWGNSIRQSPTSLLPLKKILATPSLTIPAAGATNSPEEMTSP